MFPSMPASIHTVSLVLCLNKKNPKRAQFIGYLWGNALNDYLSDMVVAQTYALYNHHIIRDHIFAILKKLCKAKYVEPIFYHTQLHFCQWRASHVT